MSEFDLCALFDTGLARSAAVVPDALTVRDHFAMEALAGLHAADN